MKRWLVGLAVSTTVFPLTGCGGSFDNYSPSQIHRTVQSRGGEIYIVFYQYFDVLDQYGPGVERVRGDVQKELTTNAKQEVWTKAEHIAVPKYLEAKGLTPVECRNGIIVIRGGSSVEGDGWAEFRCKEAK